MIYNKEKKILKIQDNKKEFENKSHIHNGKNLKCIVSKDGKTCKGFADTSEIHKDLFTIEEMTDSEKITGVLDADPDPKV